MFFKNLTIMRYPTALDFSQLEELLPHCTLKPVGALEMSSRGFVSPFGRESSVLVHRVAGAIVLSVGAEDKMLPSVVINDHVAKRLAEIEEKEGRKPGGRERKRIKDDILHDLLPKAFVKRSTTYAMLLPALGLLVVDTSSRKTAENVASDIRGLLGSFPAMPLNAEIAPRSILTAWIAGEPLPDGLSIGEECELRDPVEGGAKVRCTDQELRCDEIDKHLDAGKQVTRLALVLEDNLSFVLGDDLIARKLKFLDGAIDKLDQVEAENRTAELDARFALQVGEISRLFGVLEQAFRISKMES